MFYNVDVMPGFFLLQLNSISFIICTSHLHSEHTLGFPLLINAHQVQVVNERQESETQ